MKCNICNREIYDEAIHRKIHPDLYPCHKCGKDTAWKFQEGGFWRAYRCFEH